MAYNSSLNVSFVGRSIELGDPKWINLEQEKIPETTKNATLASAFSMWSSARAEMTARLIGMPDYMQFVDGWIIIKLDFFVFPGEMDLPYSLSLGDTAAGENELSGGQRVTVRKVGNVVVPLSDTIELPYLPSSNEEDFNLTWDTPVYNTEGEIIEPPEYTLERNIITFEKEVFGVARLDLKAQGYKYTATLRFQKTESERKAIAGIIWTQEHHNSIFNIKCIVSCLWTDSKGAKQTKNLELKIPPAVLEFLEECPKDGTLVRDTCLEPELEEVTIYYSTCTGEILKRIRKTIDQCDNDVD